MFNDFISKDTDFFVEKMRKAFTIQCKSFSHCFNKKILTYLRLKFEQKMLTVEVVSFEQPGPGVCLGARAVPDKLGFQE